MKTRITRPIAAAAALAAVPAASALVLTNQGQSSLSSRPLFGRPSFLKLEARRQSFSELDRLKAKRMGIARSRRQPEPEPQSAAEVETHDALEDTANYSLTTSLEYLYDAGEERHSDDLFHIILMPSTFNKDNFMSVEYAAHSCAEILGIDSAKAQDLSLFAKHQGFSCLGTWTREECLSMGEQLSRRELDCRVIPFTEGVLPEGLPEMDAIGSVSAPEPVVEDTYLFSYSS